MSPRLEISPETHSSEALQRRNARGEWGIWRKEEVGEKPVLYPSEMLMQVTKESGKIALSGEIFIYLDLEELENF